MFSEQTKQQYLQRAKKIQKKYFRERAKTWQDDPNGFIDWVAAIGKNWVKSTWRLTFRTIEVSLEEDGAPFEVLEYLKKTAHDGYKERMSSLHQKRKIYGGPQRKKAISQADLDRFLSVLRADSDTVNGKIRSSQYDYLLLTFMEMNVYLGLRPNEAADIQLEKVSDGTYEKGNGFQWAVRVRNSKISEARKHLWEGKEYRMLTITENLATLVKQFITERDRLMVFVPEWDSIQKALARRVRDVADALELYGITLYTTRHQYAANAKKNGGVGGGTVGKSMGHSSDKTSRMFYGPTKKGWGTAQDKAVTNVQLTGNTKVVANEADTDTVTADRF